VRGMVNIAVIDFRSAAWFRGGRAESRLWTRGSQLSSTRSSAITQRISQCTGRSTTELLVEHFKRLPHGKPVWYVT
jgi:hypothetical protein